MGELIIRLFHKAGRNRITMEDTATIDELVEKIAATIGVPERTVDLYLDEAHTKPVKASGSSSL